MAEGVLSVLLDRFMWIDDSDAVAVAELTTSLVAAAASNASGLKGPHIESVSRVVRACAKFAQKMRRGSEAWRKSGAVWREEGGVLEAAMKTGRVAAHTLAAAQQRMVPLHAYAAVASFVTVAAEPGTPGKVTADVSLRSWAAGPAACAALRAVSGSSATAAADVRAAALLLNSAAPAGPALRSAAAAACALAASAAPLGALAGLSNALRYSGFTRHREGEALNLVCSTLERELILRYGTATLSCVCHAPHARGCSTCRVLNRTGSFDIVIAVYVLYMIFHSYALQQPYLRDNMCCAAISVARACV